LHAHGSLLIIGRRILHEFPSFPAGIQPDRMSAPTKFILIEIKEGRMYYFDAEAGAPPF
jgi:hypothetical protein